MKITELTASLGRTIQMAAYEPLNLHVSFKAEIGEKEDPSKCFEELMERCKKDLYEQEKLVRKRMAENKAEASDSDNRKF